MALGDSPARATFRLRQPFQGAGYLAPPDRDLDMSDMAVGGPLELLFPELRSLAARRPDWNSGAYTPIGTGVRQDYAQAAKWFQKGAEQGDTVSQYNLGFLYYTGRGVPQDHAEAANWFWKSAVEGNPNAQFALGSMYDNGDGVKQDYEKASKWYLKAAMQGDANAQFALGSLYFAGQGVPQDFLQSYYWSGLAASGMSGDEYREASNLRDMAEKKLTPDEITEAQRMVRKWENTHPMK